MVREQGQHLVLALEILLLGVAHPVGIVDVRVGGQADEPVVDGTVLLPDEVDVVRRNDLHPVLLRHLEDDLVVDHLVVVDFPRQARNLRLVEHHFQVVVVAEHVLVPFDDLVHLGHVARQDGARHLARHAGGAADQALVVLLQHLVADARAVIHALDVRRGHDLHEVLVALVVLRQQNQVVVALLLHPVVPHRHVHLAPDDRLHRRMLLRVLEELLGPVHVPVVRDREPGHPELLGAVEQVVDGRLSVQDGILGMYVQVNERHGATILDNKDSTLPRILRKKLSTKAVFRPQRIDFLLSLQAICSEPSSIPPASSPAP